MSAIQSLYSALSTARARRRLQHDPRPQEEPADPSCTVHVHAGTVDKPTFDGATVVEAGVLLLGLGDQRPRRVRYELRRDATRTSELALLQLRDCSSGRALSCRFDTSEPRVSLGLDGQPRCTVALSVLRNVASVDGVSYVDARQAMRALATNPALSESPSELIAALDLVCTSHLLANMDLGWSALDWPPACAKAFHHLVAGAVVERQRGQA